MKQKLLITLFLFPFIIYSQNEGSIWYFGEYAGLDFTAGSPVALTNSGMNKDEGCASICDSAGSLLFYTSGIEVWNKNHQVMNNGSGLAGHNSSTQSALIVPKPGSNDLYYIFTTDAFFYSNGLKYSVVDMSLSSGLGTVTQKNVSITTPVTEKLTAVKHANGTDYWVIAHYNNNSFAAYPVTSSGIGTPVVTPIGVQHVGGGTNGTLNAIGYMKTSPSGSKIACTIMYAGIIELFDFNITTGVVSNPVTFNNPTYYNPYGIEFSPNEQVLYFTADTVLYQVDLSSGSASTIINSVQKVGASTLLMSFLGALQLGPDQRIYCVDFFHDYVSVINNPNALGAECMFVHDGVYLNNQHCYAGLPNFVTSFFDQSQQSLKEISPIKFIVNCFPNPAADYLNFEIRSKCQGTCQLKVLSYFGNIVFEKKLKKTGTGKTMIRWKIPTGISNGIYIYNFRCGETIHSEKLVINR